MLTKTSYLIILMLTSSCATSNRGKTLALTAASATAGAAYGYTRAEAKSENALFYAATLGITAAVTGLFIFDEEKVSENLKREKKELEEKIAALSPQPPQLVSEGSNLLSAPLPSDVSNLIRPGSWRRYRMDQWVQDETNANVWYRQREMFEVVPPGQ